MSSGRLEADLTGRVALVTGASSGLGRRFAQTLARAGASVVVAARRIDRLEDLVAELAEAGGSAAAVQLDVCDAEAIRLAVDAAEARFGIVDILINNAGVADANYATRLSLETIDRTIDVNFRAPFLLAVETARRLMAAGKPGRIVNISSSGAYHFAPKSAAALYSAAKAGIVRMTETLAMEWAEYGINVNAIAPGMFKSEMSEGFIARVGDGVAARFPRHRFGEPEYLDSTLLYLVSPASHFVTGTCILVDDAQYAR
jgi:NAD(P)-dependent dehydrogenase (short-subunit alcohol dehydrogenase family)